MCQWNIKFLSGNKTAFWCKGCTWALRKRSLKFFCRFKTQTSAPVWIVLLGSRGMICSRAALLQGPGEGVGHGYRLSAERVGKGFPCPPGQHQALSSVHPKARTQSCHSVVFNLLAEFITVLTGFYFLYQFLLFYAYTEFYDTTL